MPVVTNIVVLNLAASRVYSMYQYRAVCAIARNIFVRKRI